MASLVVDVLGELWELPDPVLGERWARCLTSEEVGRELSITDPYGWTSAATVQSIEARAGELLMFHAAGLSNPQGDVVALVGPSGTGKSTVSRTLCRHNFGYVTDETVAVRLDGTVLAFPKPIATIPDDGGGKIELSPDALGLQRCPDNLRLRGLVVLERSSEHTEPTVQAMELLEGIAALVPDMSALPQLPNGLAHLVDAIDRAGGVFRIRYAEASQIAELVDRVLAAPAIRSDYVSVPPNADVAVPPVADVAVPPVVGPTDTIRRADFRDALVIDDTVVLLLASSCLQLQGIGAHLWLAAEQELTLAGLRDEVVAAAGDHPEAELLVARAVDALVENRALLRT